MFYFEGNQVIESHLMADFTETPERQISFKRWMVGKCYCIRVNKKWLKRYGVKSERLFLMGMDLLSLALQTWRSCASK